MIFSDSTFIPIVAAWAALSVPALIIGVARIDIFARVGGKSIGPCIPSRWGWFIMELPALMVFPAIYFTSADRQLTTDILVAAWLLHYLHRTLMWPWIVPRKGSPMPVITMTTGFTFNIINGLLLAWFITTIADYTADWLSDPRFITGAVLFLTGATLNIHSEYHLTRLRKKNPDKYILPQGGTFRFISSPHLTGEIIEWLGFALMTCSPAALAFALWTAANLIPRALWRHHWYQSKFDDYPKERRALIPGVL